MGRSASAIAASRSSTSRGRPPADGGRERDARPHLQRRALQLPRAAPRARGPRPRLRLAHRHRGRSRLVREWGAACLERFDGMFAFAVWDTRERRLFLARDRLGVKPLYYASSGGRIVFASEIKAILEASHRAAVQARRARRVLHVPERLLRRDALSGDPHAPPPDTPWASRPGRPTLQRYWDFAFHDRRREPRAKECVEQRPFRLRAAPSTASSSATFRSGATSRAAWIPASITAIAARQSRG